jgi:uracil-DNA glycosylase family protein
MPARRTLPALRAASATCRGCDLWKRGTRTVFGQGPPQARVMMVGEQPGHEEDMAGQPFVGPAGRILDRALAGARIARDDVYVTNVVKHFKWEPRGKRRIHAKPNQMEIAACLPWLQAELGLVKPEAVVCLGATAAQALLGPRFRVTRQRGQWLSGPGATRVLATVHPSSILRAPDHESRRREFDAFVADLALVRAALR